MLDDERPDPEILLKQLSGSEHRRGRLKIFFGACAGVGKTYAMLSAAHEKIHEGVNVKSGIVETHGRFETQQLLKGIQQLPLIEINLKGISLYELDIDKALKEKPTIILMDEMAHTNAPGSRHPKRWMDIKDLINAGIDVYTTLNVQHLESLNSLIASTTGINMKETVPDSLIDEADDITLIDIPSEELIERLNEGKIYTTTLGKKRAADNFFRLENLMALRELALRRTAERVDVQQDTYAGYLHNKRRGISERIAVCIGPGDLSSRLIHSTKRLANGLKAPWVAIYVENSRHYNLDQEEQVSLEGNLRLAEQLGGKIAILHDDNAAKAILEYLESHGIGKIFVGKPQKSSWRKALHNRSLANNIIRDSGNIDVYVIAEEKKVRTPHLVNKKTSKDNWNDYSFSLVCPAFVALLCLLFEKFFNSENFVMLYLIGIVFAGARYGWKISITTSIVSFVFYNFAQPCSNFSVSNYNDIITIMLLFSTGIIAGVQTSKLRAQSKFFRIKERNTATLYTMSHLLMATHGYNAIVSIIRDHLEEAFDAIATVWLKDQETGLKLASHPNLQPELKEEQLALWSYKNNQSSGIGTVTLPGARGHYIPLEGATGIIGVLGLIPRQLNHQLTFEESAMLETFCTLAAAALERAKL